LQSKKVIKKQTFIENYPHLLSQQWNFIRAAIENVYPFG